MKKKLEGPLNWESLTDLVNSNPDSQLLEIGFQMEEIGSRIIYYERSLIRRIVFHENLFSITLNWKAMFDPFSATWLWLQPPDEGGKSVQIIDHDVSNKQPIEEEGPLKGLIKIVHYCFR